MNKLRVLFAALLLLPLPALAAGTFFWTCEATTLGSDSYSAGDTTATASGGISISSSSPLKGSNSCLTTDGNDYFVFSPTSIVNLSEMGFAALFRWTTSVPSTTTFSKPLGTEDTTDLDRVGFSSDGDGSPRLLIQQQGRSAVNLTLSTTITADTTYFLTAAYDIAGDRRYIRLYNGSTCALIEEQVDTSTDLSLDTPGTTTEIRAGNNSGTSAVLRTDTFIYANDYDDPLVDACAWTSFYPTFTAGPSAGTHTSSQLQITYTPDQAGTAYGVACPDGQTASHSQILAGNCSGGAASATFSEVGATGVGETETFSGLTASTTYDTFYTYVNTLGGSKASVSSLADQTTAGAGGVSFSVGPTLAAATNGYTVSGTITGAGTLTVEAVACAPGDAAPSNAELEAGQCGGGNAAIINASEVWTTGVSNNFPLTAANKPPRLDVYVAGTDGTNDTSVTTFSDQDRSADSGQTIIGLTSIAATSIFDLDTYFDPDVAASDVVEHDNAVNESANCWVKFQVDGDFDIFDHTDGSDNSGLDPTDAGDDSVADCGGPLTFEYCIEDYSSATTAEFTAPACWSADDTVLINNSAPVCNGPEDIVVLTEDVAMTAIDLLTLGECDDPNGDTLTATLDSGSLPTGTSLGSTGNLTWSGTPTTENEAGAALTFELCDAGLACDTFDVTVYVINTWTVPNLNSLDTEAAETAIVTAAPWRASSPGFSVSGFLCGNGEQFLTVTSQNPLANSEATAFQGVSAYIVGAVIPDLTGMTVEEALAAIEAICP